MSETDLVGVMRFEKRSPGGKLHCQVEVFRDGSAYVNGNEIEMGFEESRDAWKDAVKYLESRGYVKVPDVGK